MIIENGTFLPFSKNSLLTAIHFAVDSMDGRLSSDPNSGEKDAARIAAVSRMLCFIGLFLPNVRCAPTGAIEEILK